MMMLTVLALSAISSTMASTKVVTRTMYSVCASGDAPAGTATVTTAVKNGCSTMGYADCANSYFLANSTDGLNQCADKVGTRYNITGVCQASNLTLACADIDGSKAAEVTAYAGATCNGTATPFGVVTASVCTFLTTGTYIKMWTNTTGSFVATYTAAGCDSSTQNYIVFLSATGTSGCVAGSIGATFNSVKWGLLELPTSAPTSTNGTNTTAPKSSGNLVAASLASAVVAAATLML
jgi:hypothetical protein